MQTFNFGFEAPTLQNSEVQDTFGPSSADLTLVGYEISLSMYNPSVPFVGAAPTSQVLFYAMFVPSPDAWGNNILPAVLKQTKGGTGANLGGGPLLDSIFAASILKMVPGKFVNQVLHMTGLSIPVPAGSYLKLFAGHSGVSVDFEAQGCVYLS